MDPNEVLKAWEQTLASSPEDKPPRATFEHPPIAEPVTEAPDTGEPFRDLVELGRGGMGVVYRAHQAGLRRSVALKMALADERTARSMFVAEARVTGVLDHPNIVPVYDLVTNAQGKLCLVMKLVSGQSWKELLHPEEKRPDGLAADHDLHRHITILLAVCQALAFAHHRGIVHCDLKPENVMIGAFGEVVVMDWGCALDIGADGSGRPPLTRRPADVKAPFGTPAYLPPELALGRGDRVSPRTDVFLLGAILHELITGHPPYPGRVLAEVLLAASECPPPIFDSTVPETLQAVCRKAMAASPADRYPDAQAFRRALEDYVETRESQRISNAAKQVLSKCQEASRAPDRDHHDEYVDLAAALVGFQNAASLWPGNSEAWDGAAAARRLFITTALSNGDLGLADAYVRRIPDDAAERDALRAGVERAVAERARSRSQTAWLRFGFAGSLVAALAITLAGSIAVNKHAQLAESALALAEQRLTEVRRLSDIEALQEMDAQDAQLWPAEPAQVDRMAHWIEKASTLIEHLPIHAAKLALLRASATGQVDGAWTFATYELRWEHDTIARVVAGLERLRDVAVPAMVKRQEAARTLLARSIDAVRPAWDAAIAQVKSSPRYGGLVLKPQLGLVPLGADAASGLHEFAHLGSGAAARRAADGKLAPRLGDGLVMVLIPGGDAKIGATTGEKGDHVDPHAKPIEQPVHTVRLDPFFLSKYEMTQDQWVRFTGQNPSAYPPGKEVGGVVISALHPVEQMRKDEALEVLRRLGLTLPTEVQWEYAARGGTGTVFWTGDDPESLKGALNIADHYARTHEGPESWVYSDFLDDGNVVHAPVGHYRANPYGLHDTAGNVWEWCLDLFGAYTLPTDPGTGRRRTSDDALPIFRGGGFRANPAHARSADRYSLYGTDYRAYDVGVRPARLVER